MFYLVSFVIGFAVLLVALVQLFKGVLNNSGKKIAEAGSRDAAQMKIKKYYSVDLAKYSGLFLAIGFVISLALSLIAFEWKTYDEIKVASLGTLEVSEEAVIDIPPTVQQPPPPPTMVQPEIVEVPDEEEVEENIKVDLNVEVNSETKVTAPVEVPKQDTHVEEEVTEEIFTIVEEGAEPDGGYEKFYEYIKKNLKYPSQARRMGVEGKVYVQFIVDKDGSLNDIKAVKGIGAGCDEEAERVIKEAKKWKAGKQRGRAVKQKIVIPIAFKLG